MQFVDQQLVRLASASTQPAFFDEDGLERIARAAYHLEPGVLDAPWSAAFDELDFASGFPLRQTARIEARWDASMRAEAQLDLQAEDGELQGVSAIWRGAIIGRGRVGGGRVDRVVGGFPGLDLIDAAIDGRGAPPPASGPAREAARREEIARRLAAAAGRPGSVSGDDVATLLTEEGADEVGTFLATGQASRRLAAFMVRFASDVPAAPVPVRLELVAAIFIFDPASAGFSLGSMLSRTRKGLDVLAGKTLTRDAPAGLRRRNESVAIWVVPASWFDDADWPGAGPAERLAEASAWLQPHGIALVTRA